VRRPSRRVHAGSLPSTRDLVGALTNRSHLQLEIAAAKAAAGGAAACVFDGKQELAVLEAAAATAARFNLPAGPSVTLAQVLADCGKHAQAHWLPQLESNAAVAADAPARLAEARASLRALNEIIFSAWARAVDEWQPETCGCVKQRLQHMLEAEFDPVSSRCGEAVYSLMLTSVLLSAGEDGSCYKGVGLRHS